MKININRLFLLRVIDGKQKIQMLKYHCGGGKSMTSKNIENCVLEVKQLCKKYPAFELKNVSFALERGKITGFIGRNGAGKSTTLNSLLKFVHPDDGEILYCGQNVRSCEMEMKQSIGFVSSGMTYYPNKKLKAVTNVTKSFYKEWDETVYQSYMREFALDENKTFRQLSMGMKIKYALALALSHNAELLILDEPTSGLDPVSRENLLEIFMNLCDRGKTIFFSTHITSDLDKCADNIIYIRNGQIVENATLTEFVNTYKLVEYCENELSAKQLEVLVGKRRIKTGYTSLVRAEQADIFEGKVSEADLEAIMVHLESEGEV